MSSRPIFDSIGRQKQREADLARLGVVPAPEALPGWRRQRLAELGIVDVDLETAGSGKADLSVWVPVTSSNVEAIRWVGGPYGLQVRFLAKKRSPSRDYEYGVPESVYWDMLWSESKGKFVWGVLRDPGVSYRPLR